MTASRIAAMRMRERLIECPGSAKRRALRVAHRRAIFVYETEVRTICGFAALRRIQDYQGNFARHTGLVTGVGRHLDGELVPNRLPLRTGRDAGNDAAGLAGDVDRGVGVGAQIEDPLRVLRRAAGGADDQHVPVYLEIR